MLQENETSLLFAEDIINESRLYMARNVDHRTDLIRLARHTVKVTESKSAKGKKLSLCPMPFFDFLVCFENETNTRIVWLYFSFQKVKSCDVFFYLLFLPNFLVSDDRTILACCISSHQRISEKCSMISWEGHEESCREIARGVSWSISCGGRAPGHHPTFSFWCRTQAAAATASKKTKHKKGWRMLFKYLCHVR